MIFLEYSSASPWTSELTLVASKISNSGHQG
jgi:hypothetical protein